MRSPNGSKKGVPKICVLGLGGGGYHWEAQKVLSLVRREIEIVLVFSGPWGGLRYWNSRPEHVVVAEYVVRSPSLTGDSTIRKAALTVANVMLALRILIKERPDVMFAVGTAQAVPFGAAGRLLGTPLWFVESVTRAAHPSKTAILVRRLKLAQRLYFFWPTLERFLPGAVSAGAREP